MRDYVRVQTARLLRRLAYQVNRAAKSGDAESIHDLRVAIRRFSRCLRVFSQFYPGNSWKKIRHQLSGLMASAGAVRDMDIAMELLASESKGGNRQLISKLKQQRRQANRELFEEVQHWNSQSFSKKWRNSSGLERMRKPLRITWDGSTPPAGNARKYLPQLVADYFAQGPRVAGQQSASRPNCMPCGWPRSGCATRWNCSARVMGRGWEAALRPCGRCSSCWATSTIRPPRSGRWTRL